MNIRTSTSHRIGKITRLGITLAILFCGGGMLVGGEMPQNQVSADASWYAHFDIDAFKESSLGRRAIEMMDEKEQKKLWFFETFFKFSLLDDLNGVTLFGLPEIPDKGVVFLKGRFDQEHLTNLVSMNETYSQSTFESHVIHAWDDKDSGKRSYGSFQGSAVLMLTDSEDLLKHAIRVVNGRLSSLKPTADSDVISSTAPVIVIGVADFSAIGEVKAQAALVKQVKYAALSAVEVDDLIKTQLIIRAISEEAAINVVKILDGLRAFAALNEDKPGLALLVDHVAIDRNESEIKINLNLPVETVIEALKKHKGAQKAKNPKPSEPDAG